MHDQIVSLTKKLIAIDTNPHKPKELEECLEYAISQVSSYTVERFERNGAKSVLVYNTKTRPKKFKIILNGHLDIIPGKEHQYKPYVKDNKLYGVGSMDMKANAACMTLLFNELANKVKYPLALQLVTDEELGGFDGTKYQVDEGVRADFIIVGESTHLDIENKTKGILWAKISCKGVTAHGAYPWKGENAIWKMNQFLPKLAKLYPNPKKQEWVTTINLSKIETTNATYNKIPDDCTVWLDIRFIPEDKNKVVSNIKKILPKDFTMDISVHEPALDTDKNNEYIKLLKNKTEEIAKKKVAILSAMGSSDCRHFARVNNNSVEFGAIGGGMGSDEEWIDIPSLEKYYEILKDFLLSI